MGVLRWLPSEDIIRFTWLFTSASTCTVMTTSSAPEVLNGFLRSLKSIKYMLGECIAEEIQQGQEKEKKKQPVLRKRSHGGEDR